MTCCARCVGLRTVVVIICAAGMGICNAISKEVDFGLLSVHVVDYHDQVELPVPQLAALEQLVGRRAELGLSFLRKSSGPTGSGYAARPTSNYSRGVGEGPRKSRITAPLTTRGHRFLREKDLAGRVLVRLDSAASLPGQALIWMPEGPCCAAAYFGLSLMS
jgi:hypothetical protein